MRDFLPKDQTTLVDVLGQHAITQPNKTALIWYGFEISYRELNDLTDRCASLLEKLGVQKGDRVGILMENCPQFFVAYFGIQKLGAVVCPFNPLLKQIELEKQIVDLDIKGFICADDLKSAIQKIKSNTRVEFLLLSSYLVFNPVNPTYSIPSRIQAGIKNYDHNQDFIFQICQQSSVSLKNPSSENDVALMLYTSGTTGNPKGAMLTYRNIMFKVKNSAIFGRMKNDDVHLIASPLHHVSGLLYGLSIPIYLGGTVVLHAIFSPISILESIAAHRITYWKGSAPMLVEIMNVDASRKYDLSSLRMTTASSFGIQMSNQLIDQWCLYAGKSLCSETGYGMSETHTNDAMMPPDQIRVGTHGKPLPGVDCRILNRETGEYLPSGCEGEILLRSPGNFIGYWNQPGMTAEVLRDGWLHTGDIGKLDDDGYLIFLGRYKQLIKVSGYSVFPSEIEYLLLKNSKILDVAVIGFGESESDQLLKAFIVLKPEWQSLVTTAEILRWCRDNMTIYKIPRKIEFRQSLPKTASGKVLYRLLQ
jgi:long-chain acyl-CoA synthetase